MPGVREFDQHLIHCTEVFGRHLQHVCGIRKFHIKYKSALKSKRRRYSFGGYDLGNGSFVEYVIPNVRVLEHTSWSFLEYRSYNKDPIIGGFKGNWRKYFTALAAHEVAHAFQYNFDVRQQLARANHQLFPYLTESSNYINLHDKKSMLNSHRTFFRDIYAILRSEFVNQL